MNKLSISLLSLVLAASSLSAQTFKVKAGGTQTFNFEDKGGRNQVTFFSTTPLEDITGTANGISGSVTFDVAEFARTIKGKLTIQIASMNTGIELRNKHMQSPNWLDAARFPEISFEIKSVYDVKQSADNKLEFKVKGDFTLHGITKEVIASADATYLDESEQTKKRAPGDLIGVRANFTINLSDYGVDNAVIGNKVSEKIQVGVNVVGSNKK
ncbi:MAG: YceI family protein [Melioribacteraceae bacterium]